MQKTEFQVSGYLYKRGLAPGSAWTNRFVTLSLDTGAMKFYVEKSGKRTVKGLVNVKKGRLTLLDQNEVGKPFAFEIVIDELVGKSEDSTMILYALDQSQLDQWKESIESCFTIGDMRRRKSMLLMNAETVAAIDAANANAKLEAVAAEEQAAATAAIAAAQAAEAEAAAAKQLEVERLAAEAEAKRIRDAETARLAAEAEVRRAQEVEAKRVADAEAKRVKDAETAARKLAAAEKEEKRQKDIAAEKLAKDKETQRLAAEKAEKLAKEVEEQRLAEKNAAVVAEALRVEAQRVAAEAEMQRVKAVEAEAAEVERVKAVEAARVAAEADAQRIASEAAAAQAAAAAIEAQRLKDAEAQRLAAIGEEAKKAEAQRVAAELESTRLKEAEAQRIAVELEAKRQQEEAALPTPPPVKPPLPSVTTTVLQSSGSALSLDVDGLVDSSYEDSSDEERERVRKASNGSSKATSRNNSKHNVKVVAPSPKAATNSIAASSVTAGSIAASSRQSSFNTLSYTPVSLNSDLMGSDSDVSASAPTNKFGSNAPPTSIAAQQQSAAELAQVEAHRVAEEKRIADQAADKARAVEQKRLIEEATRRVAEEKKAAAESAQKVEDDTTAATAAAVAAASTAVDSEASPKDSESEISAEQKAALLAKVSGAKSYKVPKFKNLLNSNGIDPNDTSPRASLTIPPSERKDFPVPVDPIIVTTPVTPVHVEEETFSTEFHKIRTTKKDRVLSIPVRPTETVRMGYLAKFDTNSKEQGEDAWMTQYCSMDVSAGVLVHFAEINGKRIQRGKFDINANNVYTIDRLFHGKLFSFKITKPPTNSSNSSSSNNNSSRDKVLPTPAEAKEEEVLVTFAAEDLQSLNYWLLSFEDCALKLEEARSAAREKEEADKLALLAAQLEMDKLNQSQRRATADEYNSDSDEDDEDDLPIERRHARSKSYTPFMVSTETDETAASNATSAANTAANTAHNTPAHSSSQAALLSPKDTKDSHHPPVSSLVASAVKTLAKNPSFHFQKRTADSPVVEVEDADHKINSSTLNAAVKALTTKPSFHFPATITVNSKNGSSKQLLVTSSEMDDLFEDNTPGFSPAQPSPAEPSLQMHSAAPAIKKASFNKGSFIAAHCASAPATPHGTDHTHHIAQNHHTNQGVEEHKFQNQTAAHTAFNSSSGSVHSLLSKANSASLASLFGPVETVRDDDLDRQLGLETSPPPLPQRRSDVTPLRINTDYSPSPAETHHNQSFGSKNVVMVPVKPVINEDLAQMTFEVKKIRYPAERLCRRIKIWYCSSGFSLSTESSIEQFVTELRNTGDSTLEKFADEKFDNILDWANLLEVLRKYEQRLLLEEAPLDEDDGKSELVSLSVEARVPGRDNRLSFDLDEEYTVAQIAEVIGKEFQFTAEELALQLPTLLTKEGNPLNRGLGMMKDDLTFAEDLILYQEEVIDHLWDSYSKIKALVTQRDEVINQLYTTINTLQDQNKALKEGTHASNTDTFHLPMGSPLSRTPKIKHKPLDGTADRGGGSGRNLEERDFNQIDADGDGQISRDEWRRWIEEKSALIAEHNETKSNLIKEIRTLRKTLNPSTEQSYLELRRSEAAREKLEEELVKAHIQSDSLKTEVASLKQQLQDSESERGLVESDWEERFRALSAQLEEANQALMYQNSNPSLESLAQSTVTPYKDTPFKDSVSFAANTNGASNSRTNPSIAGRNTGNTGKPVKSVPSPPAPAPVPVMSDHGIDRDAASRNIYNFSMELKDNADDDEDYRHYLQQQSSGQQDTSALWIQKYIYGGGDHNQTLLGSAPADDYTEQQGQWGVTSNDHYSGHYGQQEDLTRSLGNYTSNNPPLVPGRRPSQPDPQQQQRYDLSSSLPASSNTNNHNKAPVSNSRVMTRPPLAVNTYDLTGGYTNEFTETGLLISRSNNAVLADHPLRAALRNDTINKLNGNGKALAQPSRQGFKFTPRGAAQSARKNDKFGSPGFNTTPMSPNPLDRSRTAGSSPARFMLNTDSWKQKSGADKEIRNPIAMQRNSGGWKFA